MTAGHRRLPQDTISSKVVEIFTALLYSLVLSTVNQLGHMSAAGRRSPPQDAVTVLLCNVLRRHAVACNVLRHCPAATVLIRKVKYIKIELEIIDS